MKIPEHIKNKMHTIARIGKESTKLMSEVEDFLESKGYDSNYLYECGGYSLRELEFGNDITDELCKDLERGVGKKIYTNTEKEGFEQVELRYIGKDNDMGLSNGQIYECKVETVRYCVIVTWKLPFGSGSHPYNSFASMFKDWEEI